MLMIPCLEKMSDIGFTPIWLEIVLKLTDPYSSRVGISRRIDSIKVGVSGVRASRDNEPLRTRRRKRLVVGGAGSAIHVAATALPCGGYLSLTKRKFTKPAHIAEEGC